MDILGPLPLTPRGNKFVLVVTDYFTKWTESYAIPNQEATTVAEKLVSEFVCRFGVPREIHSDQGTNFESKVMTEVCKLLDIEKTRTTPLHPQSDGQVERYNRTLIEMLRQVERQSGGLGPTTPTMYDGLQKFCSRVHRRDTKHADVRARN